MPTRRIGDDCVVKVEAEEYTDHDGHPTGKHTVWIIQTDDSEVVGRKHEVIVLPNEMDALISALEAARDYGKSPKRSIGSC